MAKLFVAFSKTDYSLVEPCIKMLENYKHDITRFELTLEDKYESKRIPLKEIDESDGIFAFYTLTSTRSANFLHSITDILQHSKKNDRLFIPVMEEKVEVSHIKEIPLFDFIIKFNSPTQVAEEITDHVNRHLENATLSSSARPAKKATKKSAPDSGLPTEQVKEIQTALRTLNFLLTPVDGIAGPATTGAIKKFQIFYHMPVTGEWDEQTKNKANEIINSRERKPGSATESPKQQPENKPEPSYWLLKIHGDNWRLENFKEGEDCYFNSYGNNDQPRDEYEDFKLIKSGDKGLAYDYSAKKSIVFSFDVTKSLHENPIRGEIFSFRITRFFNSSLPLNDFMSLIPIASELSGESLKKLFRLAKTEYEKLIELSENKLREDEQDIDIIKTSISLINSDSVDKIKDELDFKSDINALASIIAYKEVKPPLAIGLFGNWGSGKSFFMNKLQKRIDYLSRKGGNDFCKKILPITFNSWHYSDSNLWASLITKIFEELDDYGKEHQKDKIDELFQNLNSTKELLEKTKNEKSKVDSQIAKLNDEKTVFDDDATKQANELNNLSKEEMIEAALNNKGVKDKIENIKQQFPFLELKDDDSNFINQNIAELKDSSDKFLKSLKIIYSFRKGKIFLAVLCIVGVFAAVYYLANNTEGLKKLSDGLKIFIGVVVAFFSKVMLFLRPAMKTVNSAYEQLEKINATVDELKAEALGKFSEKQKELQKKLDEANNESERLKKEISLLSIEQKKLQSEIDDIITGKKIIRFIESRVSDERYINSLGIISWIRKDFEQLDELLKQQDKAQKTQKKEIPKIAFQLDRIILYIDDLDRCDETIVVKVLEAIHLLLAFPLFVVVVGVDPRWMHNALNKKYADFLAEPGGQKTNGKVMATNPEVANTNIGNNGTIHPLLLQAATSFDYLEKIFQIPFVLKPMDPTGKSNLIKSQFAIKNNKQDEKDKSSVDDEKNEKDIVLSRTSRVPAQTGAVNGETSAVFASPETETLVIEPGEKNTLQQPLNPDISHKPAKREEQAEHNEKDEDEEEEENTSIETERLKISEEEITFMENISFLIGESPRTIKRYINIYRIIRTHSMFEFVDANEQEHYQAAMILLALITGYPNEAKSILGSVETSSKAWTVNDFLNDYLVKNPSSVATKKLDQEIKAGKKIHNAGNIKIEKFQKNLVLTKRFSFRNLN